MEIRELKTLFRKQVQDVNKPYLWDDVEIHQYLIDAQDRFVRELGGIPDSSTRALTDIPVVAGAVLAKHSPYILRIRSAKLLTAARPLKIVNEGNLDTMVVSDYGSLTPMYLDDEDTGDVTAIVLGVENNKVRWLKVPTTEDTCRMNIMRLPYPRIKDDNSCLEIDEQHHMALLYWMKHMAYSKQDAETYDSQLAEDAKAAFLEYAANARDDKERQRYKPRVVQYNKI